MIKSSQIITWVKSHVGNGYVYGSIGQACTVDLLKQCQTQYGASMGNGYYQLNGDYTKGRCGKWIGKWVCDCSGLFKAARIALSGVWQDVSAQGTYDQCAKRGVINAMPLMPGCSVYMYSSGKGRMVHVGMYVGSGFVVEARGADYGIVITKLSERAWTHWGLLDWLEYDIKVDSGKAVVGTVADAGDASNPKPDDVIEKAWEIVTGEKALDELAAKGLVNNAESWKAKDLKNGSVPLWLFFEMCNRLSK
jgi:hypothetical protein